MFEKQALANMGYGKSKERLPCQGNKKL